MATRTKHNDEKLVKMFDEYGIKEENDTMKTHDLLETLTEEYNAFIGDGHFTPLQLRRRVYAIKYQPRKNELRREKALKERKQRQQSISENQVAVNQQKGANESIAANQSTAANENLHHSLVVQD